ncbi:MAG: ABC transporter ATP-binding protein [Clostridia bacterium]|nr:ABC transporter ATP-binding protein [Clostridia bacterium]
MKKPKHPKPKYNTLQNIAFLLRDMASAYPLLVVFLFLEATLAVLSPLLSLYVPKLALDLVTQDAATQQVLWRLGGLGLLMALAMALSSMAGQGKYIMYNSMRRFYLYKLLLQFLDCDYQHIETPEGRAKYDRAQRVLWNGDGSGTSQMTVASLDILIAILSFFLYSTIISGLNLFIVLILVGLSLISFFATKSAQAYERRRNPEIDRLDAQVQYTEGIANDLKLGKDVRLYGMEKWILDFGLHACHRFVAVYRKIRMRYFGAGVVNALVLFLRDGFAYGYLIWLVSRGFIGIGDFVLYFGAVTGFSGFVSRIVSDVNQLHYANLQMNDLRAFLDNTDEPDPEHPAPLPDGPFSIEFDHVSFSYAPDSEPVLRDFSLTVAPGEKIALVGVNGAGKTTIVKLLCGFYKPDSGEIRLNGIPLQHYCKKDLYSLFSAVFQDIFIMPFTLAENISLQTLEKTDMDRVESCLRRVGLWDAIASYPEGIRSFMLKEVMDGIVLSGGQNQKLLMARALYKDAPVLILDEPTAALDPIAESETYEAFHTLAKNKTSLYISHRLASTRFCDRIVFLADGVAAEVGTHDQLMAQGGAYAEMFEVQSHYYKEGAEETNA